MHSLEEPQQEAPLNFTGRQLCKFCLLKRWERKLSDLEICSKRNNYTLDLHTTHYLPTGHNKKTVRVSQVSMATKVLEMECWPELSIYIDTIDS